MSKETGGPAIAVLPSGEGVCLGGRWAGWLFRRHADGHWVSVKKLETEPAVPSFLANLFPRTDAMLAARAKGGDGDE